MRIGAVADVHSPKFLNEFTHSLKQCRKLDLFLLAGDIINRGAANEYHRVVSAIDRIHGDIPIIACFGNEEYNESRGEIIELMEDRVTFLDESKISLSLAGSKIGVVGASVLLERSESSPERTCSPHDDIRPAFEKRALRISQHLQMLAKSSDYTILLLHYSPLLESAPHSYSWWVSRALEIVQPALIVHGHVHVSSNIEVVIGSTRVYNVALPAVGSITELTL